MMRTLFLLAVLVPSSARAEDHVDLLLPSAGKSIRIEIRVTLDGKPAGRAQRTFLDRVFDFYDRDGSGALSSSAAARILPLPVPGAPATTIDFAKLDADGDGKGSRAEFQRYYTAAGFVPLSASVQPGEGGAVRAGELLFKYLDRDGNGRLTKEELGRAPALLRRFDADEDEVLTVSEILAVVDDRPATNGQRTTCHISHHADYKGEPDAVLSLAFGNETRPPELSKAKQQGLKFDGTALRCDGGALYIGKPPSDLSARLQATRDFHLAPFKAALGKKEFLTLDEIEASPELAYVVPFAASADRDGDDRLTLAEMEAFLDLIESGVRSRATLTLEDRGANFFDWLDANRDGRIDRRELSGAAQSIPRGQETLSRAAIPQCFILTTEQGGSDKSFGPVVLAGAPKRPANPGAPVPRGPLWFRAMDRNGDCLVSAGEFLGPPAAFARLDLDGDGFISVDEAEQADKKDRR